jgi:tRNA threonylcarbamoyladenosine modification (KEOPS) complex  Pcc1 subunit
MLTSKKYKVHAKFTVNIRDQSDKTGQKMTEAVVAAIKPELISNTSNQEMNISRTGSYISLKIRARDFISMRAMFNSFILYVYAAYGALDK